MVFTFTLHYQLACDESDMDALVERLAEEGCDDALVGVGQPGRLALEFVREAPSAHDAIEGAIEDARRAIPNASLIEFSSRSITVCMHEKISWMPASRLPLPGGTWGRREERWCSNVLFESSLAVATNRKPLKP